MKSLPPKDHASLPALDAPAGYICVIRDIDRDSYRIEATHRPQALIDAVVAEDERSFGFELVSILETRDLVASQAELYARHHARLSSEWLELDALQLAELRRSALQIDAYASHYLTRAGESLSDAAAPEMPESRNATPASYGASGARWNRLRPRGPVPEVQYGFQALRRERRAAEARRAAEERQRYERYYQLSTEDRIKESIGDFLVNHIIKITVIVFFLFILLLAFAGFSYIYY